MKIPSQFYISPEVDVVTLSLLFSIFAGSPQPGGNEDVGYEDWGI